MFEFILHLQYTHPDLYAIVKHWPLTIFMPAILLLLAVLSLVTRVWDDRERQRAEGGPHRVDGS